MTDNALETRYQRLLRAYPAAYRRARGSEIISTLMEAAAPDQRRPTAREAAALVLRGLQARVGANLTGSMGRGCWAHCGWPCCCSWPTPPPASWSTPAG